MSRATAAAALLCRSKRENSARARHWENNAENATHRRRPRRRERRLLHGQPIGDDGCFPRLAVLFTRRAGQFLASVSASVST